uniref:rho-related GTP-binding protein RhoE-like n=1 Tax=Myxine glutinosa TaxID=7769 RepID=UPI00358F5E19
MLLSAAKDDPCLVSPGSPRSPGAEAPPTRCCKVVLVGDSHCGKTALLHVFAKDVFPVNYIPTVFENYTASFELEGQRIELLMWDTSGLPHYDNVRPLSYHDSNAILICFDISSPSTLDNVLKKWHVEVVERCPNAKVFLVGCKADLRNDVKTQVDLEVQRQTPISYEQAAFVARQLCAARYIECSAQASASSVQEVFRVAALTVVPPNRERSGLKRSRSKRLLRRISRLGGRPEVPEAPRSTPPKQEKSCSIM